MLGFSALGRYALGQAPSPHAIAADVGAFTFTGVPAALSVSMPALVGTFTLTGKDATLTYFSGAQLHAAVGDFTVTGNDISFAVGMPAGVGSFTLTGIASRRALSIGAGRGTFAVTGVASTLRQGRVLYALPTVALPTGHFLFSALGTVSLGGSRASTKSGTTFDLTGQSALGEHVIKITAGTGSFTWNGVAASLLSTAYPSKIRMFPRVGRGARGAVRGGGAIGRDGAFGGSARVRAFGG